MFKGIRNTDGNEMREKKIALFHTSLTRRSAQKVSTDFMGCDSYCMKKPISHSVRTSRTVRRRVAKVSSPDRYALSHNTLLMA